MWRTIGQSHAIALLENGLRAGNLSHAYLFVGPTHIGKTTLALDLAQALNCQGTNPPCGECKSCHRIATGKHADVVILVLNQDFGDQSDTTKHIKIGYEAIEELQRRASRSAFEGKQMIFIIDGADNLSHVAANHLLKTLEEPPADVTIILLAVDETKLLPTVVSRCQHVELKPISSMEIEGMLVASRGMANDKARLLARLSEGCPGWAIMAADDDTFLVQRSQKLSALFPLLQSSWEERFDYVAQIAGDRKLVKEVLRLWLTLWRDVMLAKYGCGQAITNVDTITTIEEWAQALSIDEIKGFIASLQTSLEQIDKNANVRLVLEVLMLDMPKKKGGWRGTVSMPLS